MLLLDDALLLLLPRRALLLADSDGGCDDDEDAADVERGREPPSHSEGAAAATLREAAEAIACEGIWFDSRQRNTPLLLLLLYGFPFGVVGVCKTLSCVYAQIFSLGTVGPLYSELVSGFADLYGRL